MNKVKSANRFIPITEKGVANGVATLDGGGKVPAVQLPSSVLGAVSFQGTWNATTNTPALASGVGTKGHYYVVSVAGATNLDGITDWEINDWAIFNGTIWEKVDNSGIILSVFGRVGIVVATAGDYDASEVDNDSAAPGATVKDALDGHETRITTNDAKVTNATHTGDVEGSGALTIQDDVVTDDMLVPMGGNTIKGNLFPASLNPQNVNILPSTIFGRESTGNAKALTPSEARGVLGIGATEDNNVVSQAMGAAFVVLTSLTRSLADGTYIILASTNFLCSSDDFGAITIFVDGVEIGDTTFRAFGGLVSGATINELQLEVSTQAIVTITGGPKTVDIRGRETSGTDVTFLRGNMIILQIA